MGTGLILLGLICFLFSVVQIDRNLKTEQEAYRVSVETMAELVELGTHEHAVHAAHPEEQSLEDLVVTSEDADFIGTIEIPSIGIALPVNAELTEQGLSGSPCKYLGDIVTDDAIIAAHNYRRHFGKLHRLTEGDLVIFKDYEAHEIPYCVEKTEVIHDYEMDKLLDRRDCDLTLFTCKLNHKDRIVIRCNRFV